MLNLSILKNEEISDDLLKHVELFDKKIFSEGEFSFPENYLSNLYATNKEALFVLLNNDVVVGYVNAIFLGDENYNEYLINKDYLSLENIGLHDGDNNMYFFTVALDETIRHTSCIKFLMYEFVKWLETERMLGRRIKRTITEVITDDGLKQTKIMGMLPLNGGERDFGIYYSPDNLVSYTNKMLESSTSLNTFNRAVNSINSANILFDKFSTKQEAVDYTVENTGLTPAEVETAYDFIRKLKVQDYTELTEREKRIEFMGKIVNLAKFYNLPIFAVTDDLSTYYNEENNESVKKARDNYLSDIESELDEERDYEKDNTRQIKN